LYFFVWVDEADALGLINGTLDQDVWKAGLLRKKNNFFVLSLFVP